MAVNRFLSFPPINNGLMCNGGAGEGEENRKEFQQTRRVSRVGNSLFPNWLHPIAKFTPLQNEPSFHQQYSYINHAKKTWILVLLIRETICQSFNLLYRFGKGGQTLVIEQVIKKAVCRTAPSSQGLLTSSYWNISVRELSQFENNKLSKCINKAVETNNLRWREHVFQNIQPAGEEPARGARIFGESIHR